MKIKILMLGAITVLLGTSCNLNEQLYGSKILASSTSSSSNLAGVYSSLNGFATQSNTYALQEHSTDEMMGPTRGTDWGDFGTWRKLHTHTWDASYQQISDTWDFLNTGSYLASQVIANTTNNQIKAEASFIRAYYMFQITDLFGQVPMRDPNASPDAIPTVLKRSDAVNQIITDLTFAEANLGPASGVNQASKAAAEALLAKVYLNKAVYTASAPSTTYTFDPGDMTKVVNYCNAVQANGGYQLAPAGSYYANFDWNNQTGSTEIIFGLTNTTTQAPASPRFTWMMGTHYLQTTGGWNGFTTLAAFYNSFDPKDERLGGAYPGLTDKTGLRAGFLIGQQYGPINKSGTPYVAGPLPQRNGSPLIYTPDVNLNFSTEAQGIRVIKYLPHPTTTDGFIGESNYSNTYILLRYADVRLMKAEALSRGGTDSQGETALSIINDIRTRRGIAPLSTIATADILTERGHELFYEGWRRNDQIRFGTFNAPVDQRPQASALTYQVYAIPQRAIDTNPNLKQNAGY